MAHTVAMSDAQAADEALLLVIRKMRRLHPAEYADVVSRLADGARWALQMAENRADALRATVDSVADLDWPMPDMD